MNAYRREVALLQQGVELRRTSHRFDEDANLSGRDCDELGGDCP